MSDENQYAYKPVEETFEKPQDVTLASRWVRLAAVLIDGAIVFALYIPVLIIAFFVGTQTGSSTSLVFIGATAFSGLGILAFVIVNIVFLVKWGQTIGKKILGIRIIGEDDEKASFARIFFLRILVNGLIGAIPFLGIAYTIADYAMIFNNDRRTLHDRIANTRVAVVPIGQ